MLRWNTFRCRFNAAMNNTGSLSYFGFGSWLWDIVVYRFSFWSPPAILQERSKEQPWLFFRQRRHLPLLFNSYRTSAPTSPCLLPFSCSYALPRHNLNWRDAAIIEMEVRCCLSVLVDSDTERIVQVTLFVINVIHMRKFAILSVQPCLWAYRALFTDKLISQISL